MRYPDCPMVDARAPAVAIHAAQLSRRHGGRWALRNLDLDVEAGTALMVFGPNGAGKTTLIRMLGTALAPTTGTLRLFGLPPGDQVRPRVAMVSHADHHYDDLSARENLRILARLCPRDGDPDALLEEVGLGGRGDDIVRTFSAGMRKRLLFARMLWKKPDLVLLDEPYAGLDPAGARWVDKLVLDLRGRGATVVMSTHQLARGARLCTEALMLRQGQAAWRGPASEAPAQIEQVEE
jgi:heme exporter protein A